MTVKACSHITGGGFYENIPRMLKDGVCAVDRKGQLSDASNLYFNGKRRKYRRTDDVQYFNMGLGMVVAVDPADVDKTMEAIKAAGDTPM